MDNEEATQFVLKGPNLEKVATLSEELKFKLQTIPAIGPLDTDLLLDMPELAFSLNRGQANDAGLDTMTVSNALRVLVGDLMSLNTMMSREMGRYNIRIQPPLEQ